MPKPPLGNNIFVLYLFKLNEFKCRADQHCLFFAHLSETTTPFCHAPEAGEIGWQRFGNQQVSYFLDDLFGAFQ
jgi:hypothetical protein